MGVNLSLLLRFTLSEFYYYVKGFRKRKAIEESHYRRIAYTVYLGIPKEKGRSSMGMNEFWPIGLLDEKKKVLLDSKEANEFFKRAIKAWRLQ